MSVDAKLKNKEVIDDFKKSKRYDLYFFMISALFVPPNPKEFDRNAFIFLKWFYLQC